MKNQEKHAKGRAAVQKDGESRDGDIREEELKEILGYYSSMTSPSSQENIVSMLQEIQELYGCISREHSEMAAEAAGVKTAVIDCIMKLYKSLKPAPYRHRLTVCSGKNCYRKRKNLLDAVKKELGIKGKIPDSGALSSDKKILLETRGCLKHCRTAPNFLLDGKLYPCAGEDEIKKLIKELRAEEL